jgi:hypothetical protein
LYLGFRRPPSSDLSKETCHLGASNFVDFFTASRQATNIASNKNTIVAFHFLIRKLYCAANVLF